MRSPSETAKAPARVICLDCLRPVVWHPERSAWAHAEPGADHPPRLGTADTRRPR